MDGSGSSLRAVEFARDLLVSAGIYATLLTVVTPMDCDRFMEKAAPVCDADAIAKARSRAAVPVLRGPGAENCLSARTGNPAEHFPRMPAKHHLVGMGRKGPGSSPAISLGGGSGQVGQSIKAHCRWSHDRKARNPKFF